MKKTIRLEGEALEIARKIMESIDSTNAQLSRMAEELQTVRQHGLDQAHKMSSEMKKVLGLKEEDCVHLELDYIKEHGIAFAMTGCDVSGSLQEIMERVVGVADHSSLSRKLN